MLSNGSSFCWYQVLMGISPHNALEMHDLVNTGHCITNGKHLLFTFDPLHQKNITVSLLQPGEP